MSGQPNVNGVSGEAMSGGACSQHQWPGAAVLNHGSAGFPVLKPYLLQPELYIEISASGIRVKRWRRAGF